MIYAVLLVFGQKRMKEDCRKKANSSSETMHVYVQEYGENIFNEQEIK